MVDRLGTQVGNWRLTKMLGQGGSAEVYLGEQIHLGTQAAIKLLHAPLASASEMEQFRQEARTIAALIHPQDVRVLDFGVGNGLPYLVLDYAPGGSLRLRHPAGTPIPLATVATYVQQIAQGLQYAHDQKIIHRDIKPPNLLIGRRGEVLLSDFEISVVSETTRRQQPQEKANTVAYSAPEQWQGHSLPASDQYALGVVVYEWLSGTAPFTGAVTEFAVKHLMTEPPSLRERMPKMPPLVEEVVLTALAKDPKKRFGSVRAFAVALEQAGIVEASGIQTTATPPAADVSVVPPSAQGPRMPLATHDHPTRVQRTFWWRRSPRKSSFSENTLKYYLYVSDTKLDMLYPQIPQSWLKGIASELNINLNVLGTGVGASLKSASSEETRYSKLKVVVSYIEKHFSVGTIDAPGTYFKGTLPMRWGPVVQSNAVYFGGFTASTTLGLAGSQEHIIGTSRGSTIGSAQLPASDMAGALLSLQELLGAAILENPFMFTDTSSSLYDVFSTKALVTIKQATKTIGGPEQPLEFLAIKLLEGKLTDGMGFKKRLVVLGTPIYIALAEER